MTLLVLHIPKTAGTSLRKAIESVIAPSERFYVYNPSEMPGALTPQLLADLDDERKRSAKVVMGHFEYGLHTAFGWPVRYVTVLRDPVERVVSLYSMYRREYPQQLREMGLRQWTMSSRQADNEMVRRLTGKLAAPIGSISDITLGEAVVNIDQEFAAVLVTEELDRNYARLGDLLGVQLPFPPRENVAPQALDIDDDVRQFIAERNRFDVALYRYVRHRRS